MDEATLTELREIFCPRVHQVAEICAGVPLLEADKALDDARRIAWMKVFAGMAEEVCLATLKPSRLALTVALVIDRLTVPEIEDLFSDVRAFLWMKEYAAFPKSAFGQQLRAVLDHAKEKKAGRKFH